MAGDVKRLGENIGELLTLVKSSATLIQQLQSDLKQLKGLNSTLLTQNLTLIENIQSKNMTNTKVNNKSLIIGSSLIRNFDETKLKNHTVCCMPGAQTVDVKTKLNNLAEDGNHYKSIFIVVGSNVASDSEDKVDIDSAVLAMRYKNIMQTDVWWHNDISHTTASWTSPCSGHDTLPQCIHFQAIAANMSVKFVTNNEHFYLKTDQIIDGYFHDSVHLTAKGSNKLAETLGLLNVVNGKNDGVCNYKPVQDKCFEHKINGNNDDDFDHTFWDRAKQKSRLQNRCSPLV